MTDMMLYCVLSAQCGGGGSYRVKFHTCWRVLIFSNDIIHYTSQAIAFLDLLQVDSNVVKKRYIRVE